MARQPQISRNPPPGKPQRRKPQRLSLVRRLLLAILALVLVVGTLAALFIVIAVANTAASLPGFTQMMKSPLGQSIVIRAADGSELVTIGPSYGRWLPYADIPDTMIEAMKAVEDRRFDWHPGVDPIGLARAFKVNMQRGGSFQGGSTITQQLARNIFLTSSKDYSRKIREAILALAIERKFTKQQIMELYLNRVYFGGGAYGIDAASRKFYGHPASTLSLEQAAIIAGLVKAPSRYSPTADPERARGRARVVIGTMTDSGAITPSQAANADVDGVRFVIDAGRQGNVRYYTDWILTQLETLSDEIDEPLEVTTSLIPVHQRAIEAAVAGQNSGGTQAAAIAMQTDGAVTAMVGGRDYASSIYNRATVARRQPGSAFKLFPYLVALEEGMKPDDMVVDEPIRIGNWAPRNSNGRFLGAMTLRSAFARSVNTVSVRLGARYGYENVARMARRFGITTPIDTRPAMALGASDATLIQMTTAYAGIANNGREVRPWGIQSVTTASGRVVYNRELESPRVLVAPFVAAYMTDMLRAVVEDGTGRAAQINRPLAGKTGTSNSSKDGWFIGFTPELVAGVWVGRDDAKPVTGLFGGQAPARIFQAFMAKAVAGTAATDLVDDVDLPEYGLEPDQEVYGVTPEGYINDGQADEIGDLIESLSTESAAKPAAPPSAPLPESSRSQPLTDRWLDDLMQPAPRPSEPAGMQGR